MELQFTVEKEWNGTSLQSPEHVKGEVKQTPEGLLLTWTAPLPNSIPVSPPGRLWELWNFDVVEFFFRAPSGDYIEYEFCATGHFLGIHLSKYRVKAQADLLPIAFKTEQRKDHWRGEALISLHPLSQWPEQWNVCSILTRDGERAFCSLSSTSGKPDFHAEEAFLPFSSVLSATFPDSSTSS